MNYCFQADLAALEEAGFRSKTVEAFIEGFDMAELGCYLPRTFGVLLKVVRMLPEKTREKYFAPIYGFETIQRLARERVEAAINKSKKRESTKESEDDKIPSIFNNMLNPDPSKGQVTPSKADMVADGCLMIAAGTDTTANVLGVLLWHVTQNPKVEAKLLADLKCAMPERDVLLDSATLEGDQFEYMRAVVKESLRLAYGVPGRILRVTPPQGGLVAGMEIPGGVGFSFSSLPQSVLPIWWV